MKNSMKKSKKELLFFEPIKAEMSVDEIYSQLIKVFKEKGIKIYPDKNNEKGNKKWKK